MKRFTFIERVDMLSQVQDEELIARIRENIRDDKFLGNGSSGRSVYTGCKNDMDVLKYKRSESNCVQKCVKIDTVREGDKCAPR